MDDSKRGLQIGRLSYTHHSSGEVWYLRMLLMKVRGATSFEELRTINGVCYSIFRDACKEHGLLDDDKEWHEVIHQCSNGALPPQIRQLFVHIIVNCKFLILVLIPLKKFRWTEADLNSNFPIEYLNSINIPGIPAHELSLKVGAVVMLMRNLNQTLRLCTGTRMIVTKCLRFCVECEVICGSFVGTRHFIPRMELAPSETLIPLKLVRKQMPLQICCAMTINKSHGQSLENVGLYLPKSVFTHVQYYVVISRVTSPKVLKIFVDDDS
ncbi:uncharacterized protein LOC141685536 [Apium graveolens]|uniref:uncharacterized protein LOC141685536 n=1 Tax=Apium graveolens TaxID=4045 RepID=UPI003D79BD00